MGQARWLQQRRVRRLALLAFLAVATVLAWSSLAGGTQPYDTYQSTVASDGPVAQYRFDDATGSTTLADSAGSFTATNNGIALGAEGPFGGSKSGSFGGSAYGALPSNPLSGASAFTAEAWVDWTGGASYKQPIFDFGSSSTNYVYLTPASTLTSHKMLLEIHTTAGTVVQVTATTLKASAWEYVAVTETSSGTLTLYLNGAQVGQSTGATVTPASLGTVANAYLGKSQVSGDPMFSGSMSNVAFYNKALSAAQVAAHYNAGKFPVNTSLPTITGTARDGSTLTAKAGTWSGLTPITFAYQWTRCNSSGGGCTNISSASAIKYQASHEDVGATLRVAVTGANSAGSSTASSAQTATVEALKPANETLPAVSGTAKVGQLLSVSSGTWEGTPPLSYAYQWQSCNSAGVACKAISGGTASSYRVISSQVGGTLRAVVTAANSAGSTPANSAVTAEVTTGPPVNTALPGISGTARDGQTLSASSGSWAGTEPISYTYQWQSCNGGGEGCANLSGATSSSYSLTSSNVGGTLRAVITAKNSVGSTNATSSPSAVVTAIPPSNTSAPTITGTARDEQTLTAGTGTWTGSAPISYAYQWQSCNSLGEGCSNIAGATSSSYVLTHTDVGTTLRVTVTATNAGGSANATSLSTAVVAPSVPSNTAVPTISGEAKDEQTLTASTGSWTGTPPISYAYQWQSCNSLGEGCSNIAGATNSSYVLAHSDVGTTLRIAVTATNAGGSANATSARTAVVTARLPSNTAVPTISGTVQDGQTLTASSGSWTGTPPISYTYQWQSCYGSEGSCTNIAGETGTKYILRPSDVETTPRVLVTASNSAGAIAVASEVTSLVRPIAPANISPPTITGIAREGTRLSASVGKWSGSPQLNFNYQWENCDSLGESCLPIAGATTSGYLLGPLDVASTVRVVVTAVATDFETASATSPATAQTTPGPYLVSQFGTAGSGNGQFSDPVAVAVGAGGDIWVLDRGNDRVEKCNEAGECPRTFGAPGSASGQLKEPSAIAVAPNGDVWVADTGNHRVEEFGEGGAYLRSLTETSAGPLSRPEGVAVDGQGHVWVTDTAARPLDEFTESGEYLQTLGESLQLEPAGVAAGANGDVWVVDRGHSRVDRFSFSEGNVSTRVIEGQLKSPSGIAVNAQGNIWVADVSNARIVELNELGTRVAEFGSEGSESGQFGFGRPMGLAVDSGGDVWAADPGNNRVQEWANQPVAPSNVTTPGVSGEAVVGGKLVASTGTWAGAPLRYAYQWQRCNASGEGCAPIAGATEPTYTAGNADAGMTIEVVVSAINAGGSAGATSLPTAVISSAIPPSSTAVPTISGAAQDGGALTASTGEWNGTPASSYGYQWESCNAGGTECAPVEGAIGPEYPLGDGDVGTTLRVVVSATNAAGSAQATSAMSARVLAEPPSELETPSISGVPDAHQILYANPGAWSGTERQFRYQWESCNPSGSECAPIEGATSAEYDLGEGDVSSTLRVRVGASSALASLTDVSSPTPVVGAPGVLASTAPPVTSGTPQSGQTLTASTGTWSDTATVSYSYQWQSCGQLGQGCQNIEGATSASYALGVGTVGKTVRVQVTASDEKRSLSRLSTTTQPIAAVQTPVVEQAPAITGAGLQGQQLTATSGRWSAQGAITYSYQWERCTEPGHCTPIEGATSTSHTPAEADLGSELLVLVTATNAGGSSTGVSRLTAAIDAETLTMFSAPSISGVVEPEGVLSASAGVWSGIGPVSYAYQWLRCTASGEGCVPIEGATEPNYTIAAGHLGSTLRVELTVTSSLGSKSVSSAHTVVLPGGEVSVEKAQEVAQQTDPAVFAPSTAVTLEGQTIQPALGDGEQISSQNALTTSTISKETPGEFATNTPDGELSLTPIESSANATRTPTIVNGAAALFANSSPATDTIVRPTALGATAILQLRSKEAPTSFSWDVRLGADQQLRQLPDGTVAVTTGAAASPEPEESKEPEARETGEGEPESAAEKSEAEREEGESENEVKFEPPPPAPKSSTPPAEAPPGELQPQNTQTQYEAATSTMASAELETAGTTLMALEQPQVVDASGNAVPASLTVLGDTVTLSLKPSQTTTFPVLAAVTIAAPSDKTSVERDPFEYGLADNQPPNLQQFDSRLKTGPLNVKTARLTIPWDTAWHGESGEMARFTSWLEAVRKPSVGLEPYVTFTFSKVRSRPSADRYRKAVASFIKQHKNQVKLWGAWNEPDLGNNYLPPKRAAEIWQAAQSAVLEVGCHCAVIAGEFHQYKEKTDKAYVSQYKAALLSGTFCRQCWNNNRRRWLLHKRPNIWGLHDYDDVVHYSTNSEDAVKFQDAVRGALGKPRIWLSEAGVMLHHSAGATDLFVPGNERLEWERQTAAANGFLALHAARGHGEHISRIDRVYYYSYKAPSEQKVKEEEVGGVSKAFDSGLVEAPPEGKGKSAGEQRPAYCVLAYSTNKCPPTVVTLPPIYTTHITRENIRASVNPHGLITTVKFKVNILEPVGFFETKTQTVGVLFHPGIVSAGERECPNKYVYQPVATSAGGITEGLPVQGEQFCS